MVPDAVTRFEDFCLWMYVTVDELWPRIALPCTRPGPAPVCSAPALVTMALVGECCGWDPETELVRRWAGHRDLFPGQPERSRCNRRRRPLAGAITALRRLTLHALDLAADRPCGLDSRPVPVIRFHLVPGGARAEWQASDARFGQVPAKQVTICGYKRSLRVTLNGVIRDFALAPANVLELQAGAELLEEHPELTVLGAKAFISAPVAARLPAQNRIALVRLPRRNQRRQVPPEVQRALNAARQIAETLNSQLAEQFHIETNHAQSFWGLGARLATKLTAQTLSVHLNRRLGNPDVLHIKALAFPPPN